MTSEGLHHLLVVSLEVVGLSPTDQFCFGVPSVMGNIGVGGVIIREERVVRFRRGVRLGGGDWVGEDKKGDKREESE